MKIAIKKKTKNSVIERKLLKKNVKNVEKCVNGFKNVEFFKLC